jgi:hypothetical protein
MNSIPGYSGDYRTLDKLINGINKTMDDNNMWLIPFTKNQPHFVSISFIDEKKVSGIRVWNYNKNYEHSSRGVRLLTVAADGVMVTPATGILIKKAPGNDFYDFGQTLNLPYLDGWSSTTGKMYKEIKPKAMNGFQI